MVDHPIAKSAGMVEDNLILLANFCGQRLRNRSVGIVEGNDMSATWWALCIIAIEQHHAGRITHRPVAKAG
ncbi:hypothetical protein Pla22_28960 [Rubripirellula amarantea]|uniref:Uncharacterized protein n=1 Tax=Rubripirellula amarantea TaxID=2527999 RepID=A0A5C5WH90_9BACT|nr:hypothetical protein Pla22_28960 [Rubripirellula amarantea]